MSVSNKFSDTLFLFRSCITSANFRLNPSTMAFGCSGSEKNIHLFSFALIATLRSPKKRSLLGVNEHFEGEYNDKVALLDSFISIEVV